MSAHLPSVDAERRPLHQPLQPSSPPPSLPPQAVIHVAPPFPSNAAATPLPLWRRHPFLVVLGVVAVLLPLVLALIPLQTVPTVAYARSRCWYCTESMPGDVGGCLNRPVTCSPWQHSEPVTCCDKGGGFIFDRFRCSLDAQSCYEPVMGNASLFFVYSALLIFATSLACRLRARRRREQMQPPPQYIQMQ